MEWFTADGAGTDGQGHIGAAAAAEGAAGLLLDTRSITKPPAFSGDENGLRDWSFTFRAYTAMVDETLEIYMDRAETMSTPVPPSENLGPAAQRASRTLYLLLAMMVRGRVLAVVKAAPPRHGLETWRRLCQYYEPSTASRTVSLLQTVLAPSFRDVSLMEWFEDFS